MDPRIRFVIGGVQKGGTTALASFVAQHPGVRLPVGKEAHVFDAADFDEEWDVAAIDARYQSHFPRDDESGLLHGDATPIYCFHPRLVERIARYHPGMRWILILRHPVERAVSQWQMETARGDERWPLWVAAVFERWRLAGYGDDFSPASPLRRNSYLARGDYARQLDVLFRHFPREQVLLLRNEDLAREPAEVLEQVWRFLELSPPAVTPAFGRVFEGPHGPLSESSLMRRLLSLLLRGRMREAERRYGIRWSEPTQHQDVS